METNLNRRRLATLVMATLLACSSAPALADTLPPPDTASLVGSGAPEYRIGVNDNLDISVFQIDELKRSVIVDSGGWILLPLVGQIHARGRTPGELSADIATALKKTYMKDPQVIVSVKESQSQRVTVDGAVNQPGVYPLSGPTTLLQAVSLARGPDPKLANVKKVGLFRTINGARRHAMYDLTQIRRGKAEDPQIYANDIVVVDTSSGKSFFQNFQGGFGVLGLLLTPF